jgi:hypothetical protein
MELINCHHCGRSVSFTAASCPHCGSIEPAGPYRFNRKEARRYRIEDRNDRTLILITVGFGAVGAFYGVETSSSTHGALVAGLCYGFVGAAVGVPLAFAISITAQLAIVQAYLPAQRPSAGVSLQRGTARVHGGIERLAGSDSVLPVWSRKIPSHLAVALQRKGANHG